MIDDRREKKKLFVLIDICNERRLQILLLAGHVLSNPSIIFIRGFTFSMSCVLVELKTNSTTCTT